MDKELKARIQGNKVLTFDERKNIIADLEKLEKIEQIVDEWSESLERDVEMYDTLGKIKEVLEQE